MPAMIFGINHELTHPTVNGNILTINKAVILIAQKEYGSYNIHGMADTARMFLSASEYSGI